MIIDCFVLKLCTFTLVYVNKKDTRNIVMYTHLKQPVIFKEKTVLGKF